MENAARKRKERLSDLACCFNYLSVFAREEEV